MRIIFAGNPEIAVLSLESLVNSQVSDGFCEISAVLTNPDTMKGRKNILAPTEISRAAEIFSERLAAPLVQLKPESIDDDFIERIAEINADLLISFAYGTLFSRKFLSVFPKGGINVHPSLLPKYRGAAPVQQVILNGERETGITIQRITAKLDSGDILAQQSFPLSGRESSLSLSSIVAEKAAAMLVRVVKDIAEDKQAGTPQNESGASYCAKFTKNDGLIDWNKSACSIDAQIRAFTPWPLSWTHHKGRVLYILAGMPYHDIIDKGKTGAVLGTDKKTGILIQTGDGVFSVSRLQYNTKKALGWKDFLNGANIIGDILE
ncbi:MAG: methionyl-tRNA formyltransferase [Spirochaetaceae bacterium]|nr:methionyl-tRNA formyltransferase [Spirochaetaceae bacterium]